MPKARTEREISNDGVVKVIEIETAAGGGTKDTKTMRYTVPASGKAFRDLVGGLSESPDGGVFVKSVFGPDRESQDESPLDTVYRYYVASIDRSVRAAAYESLAAESTMISVGKERLDIMTFPVRKLVQAINGMRAQKSIRMGADSSEEMEKTVERGLGFGPWKTAARKLAEGYENADGNKVAPQAQENAASGMLELIEA